MNILFILPQIPYPPHSGGRIVTWNTMKRFSTSWRVTVVCLYHHPSELGAMDTLKEYCEEIAAFPAHGKWALIPMLKSFLSTQPYKAHRFFNPDMKAYIRRLLSRKTFDVIHAQNFYTTRYVSGKENALKVHYKENVEGQVLLRYAQASRNPLVRIPAWLEGMRTRRFELRACRKFDQILSISPVDTETLLRFRPSQPVAYQSPGVDLEAYPYMDEPSTTPAVVFTGTMSYYPNADGIGHFLETAWPIVRENIPQAVCYLVGDHPPRWLRAFDTVDGIHVTGRVPNVQEYLQKAMVFIVPLRIGGGIRLKILEAMASGRAIVSTSIGCEGLEGRHGEHLLIEDNPLRFAGAIIDLLKNPIRRDQLRRNARTLMEERYDWDEVIRRQSEQYCSLHHQRLSRPQE